MARKGGVPADRVLNAMTLAEIMRYLRQKRRFLRPGRLRVRMHDVALERTVVAVAADRGHHFSKAPQRDILLVEGHGVEGDAHSGASVRHRYLARRRPHRTGPLGYRGTNRSADALRVDRPIPGWPETTRALVGENRPSIQVRGAGRGAGRRACGRRSFSVNCVTGGALQSLAGTVDGGKRYRSRLGPEARHTGGHFSAGGSTPSGKSVRIALHLQLEPTERGPAVAEPLCRAPRQAGVGDHRLQIVGSASSGSRRPETRLRRRQGLSLSRRDRRQLVRALVFWIKTIANPGRVETAFIPHDGAERRGR